MYIYIFSNNSLFLQMDVLEFYCEVFLQVKKVLTLKMGSKQVDHEGQTGLCFAMDWLHVKPHNILAAGFYDGDFICFV